MNTDRTLIQICLSLWYSEKSIERLPVIRSWNPWERVEIVPMPAHLMAGSFVSMARAEGL